MPPELARIRAYEHGMTLREWIEFCNLMFRKAKIGRANREQIKRNQFYNKFVAHENFNQWRNRDDTPEESPSAEDGADG